MSVSVAKLPNAVVVYRFPNKKKVHTVRGKARKLSLNETVENGFVFYSFDGKERYVIEKQNGTLNFGLPNKSKQLSTDKKSFLNRWRIFRKRLRKSNSRKW